MMRTLAHWRCQPQVYQAALGGTRCDGHAEKKWWQDCDNNGETKAQFCSLHELIMEVLVTLFVISIQVDAFPIVNGPDLVLFV